MRVNGTLPRFSYTMHNSKFRVNLLRCFLSACILLTLVFTPVDAGWVKTNGLEKSVVRGFAVMGGNIFVTVDDTDIFRSQDDGAHWTRTVKGMRVYGIYSLGVSGNVLFAGTSGSGLFRSTDSGASWLAVHNGFPDSSYVTSIAVTSGKLFAACNPGNVYRSTDLGDTWTAVSAGLSQFFPFSLATTGSTLFAGNDPRSKVFRSSNNGDTWQSFSTGLPDTGSGSYGIYTTRVFGKRIFATT